MSDVCVYLGDALAAYQFGPDHPFGPHRYPAFVEEFQRRGLDSRVLQCAPVMAEHEQLQRFHTRDYVEQVQRQSTTGEGFLDYGDTPAFVGVYEAAASVVGSALDAVDRIMSGRCRRAFVPIAGLHHARRDRAGGFCVFNDCGVVIETLLQGYGLERVAYVDIDAHHGDGVFYGFEDDPRVIFADMHEDGRFLYPGTGAADEAGKGAAAGEKLNIPMPPGADETQFRQMWQKLEDFVAAREPSFILLQCGADSMAGDPLTDLRYTADCHAYAAARLADLSERTGQGRLLALGGGGYNASNLAAAWCAVVEALLADAGGR